MVEVPLFVAFKLHCSKITIRTVVWLVWLHHIQAGSLPLDLELTRCQHSKKLIQGFLSKTALLFHTMMLGPGVQVGPQIPLLGGIVDADELLSSPEGIIHIGLKFTDAISISAERGFCSSSSCT